MTVERNIFNSDNLAGRLGLEPELLADIRSSRIGAVSLLLDRAEKRGAAYEVLPEATISIKDRVVALRRNMQIARAKLHVERRIQNDRECEPWIAALASEQKTPRVYDLGTFQLRVTEHQPE
ncbi:MAG TPA: hypothetical protein VF575_04340 [Candidatus Saccharimonadales bacterium]